jgi:hypothetical protein
MSVIVRSRLRIFIGLIGLAFVSVYLARVR